MFTAMPIMWYAVCDFEFPKKKLLNDPSLYKIGLEERLFSNAVFWRWILYGSVKALLIFFICFICNEISLNSEGNFGDVPSSGAITYAGIVLMANVKIWMSTSSHTIMSFLIVILSILSYFLCWMVESNILFFDLYGTFTIAFTFSTFYVAMALCVLSLIFIDVGMEYIHILKEIISTKEESIRRAVSAKATDEDEIAKALNNFKIDTEDDKVHRGFAFS